jgi:hypothetical protein
MGLLDLVRFSKFDRLTLINENHFFWPNDSSICRFRLR